MLIRVVDVENRGINIGIPASGSELPQDDVRSIWKVGAQEPVAFEEPVRITHITDMGEAIDLVVTPTCGLSDNRPIHIVESDMV